jgi:Na+/citrate or Na+/malate symporter
VFVKETEQRSVSSMQNIGRFVDAFVFVFRPQNVTFGSILRCVIKESDTLFSFIHVVLQYRTLLIKSTNGLTLSKVSIQTFFSVFATIGMVLIPLSPVIHYFHCKFILVTFSFVLPREMYSQ